MTTAREIGDKLKKITNADGVYWEVPIMGQYPKTHRVNPSDILAIITANEELAKALRKHVIAQTSRYSEDGKKRDGGECFECGARWIDGGELGHHAPTCVLAKTGWGKP